MKNQKIAIGMSGGVDSSVAAAILKKQGYEVIGITMLLWGEDDSSVKDAKAVCDKLDIRHFAIDLKGEFKKVVMDYFANEYLNGRTPNPCIVCNRFFKFDAMQQYAKSLGADKIATGHYAKIEYDEELGRYLLKGADATQKDQTYVLYSLTQEQLKNTVMPLGQLADKSETRKIAQQLGFDIADKADSMDICFIPDGDYRGFIDTHTRKNCPQGDFVDEQGNILGKHSGIINYTVGQRKGLGIAFGKPMFVIRIDAEKNQVVLGEKGSEFSDELFADKLNFIPFDNLENPIQVLAKVRYSAKAARATVYPIAHDLVKVVFDEPQRAITPGQAVVFYDLAGKMVVGGGIIRS
jgi:tRNA-specific 2-thiouridylase